MESKRTYKFSKQQDLIKEVVKLYESGVSAPKIAKLINKSRPSVCLYLKQAGIQTRRRRTREILLNEQFFDKIDTHTKAYWLGFLLADGCVANKRRSVIIQLAVRDKQHLETLLTDMQCSAVIRTSWKSDGRSKEKKHEAVSVTMCSVHMCTILHSMGWREFKTTGKTDILKSVKNEFRPSLMRGLFDGDGSSMQNRMTFTDAHLEPVIWFQESLVEAINMKRYPIAVVRDGVAFTLRLSGKQRLEKIRRYLYGAPGPRLLRKDI